MPCSGLVNIYWLPTLYLVYPTLGRCGSPSPLIKLKVDTIFLSVAVLLFFFSPLHSFDWLRVIVEEPTEPEVESPTEQHGVQQDAEDEDLLRDPDEVVIHPGLSDCSGVWRGVLQWLQWTLEEEGWEVPVTTRTITAFTGFPLIPVTSFSILLCSGSYLSTITANPRSRYNTAVCTFDISNTHTTYHTINQTIQI